MMEIEVSREQGRVPVSVLRLKGALISEEELQQRAKEEYDAGARYMLLDLSDVPYMASAGLRALHFIYSLLRPSGDAAEARKGLVEGTYTSRHLKLLKPSKHAQEALQVAGYDMFIESFQDRAQAIASFS
ncbi:MAG TPA: STAS domain-containing protein [Caldilineaceae bacterium]|nr:STAS domain-containing protein [Caldilineaceae bacterium]